MLKVLVITYNVYSELRTHKIRSTFYAENALRKLFCKPKDRVAKEDKNNIFQEIDSNRNNM